MISFDVLFIGFTFIASMTGLVTEAVKRLLTELNVKYYSNTLAGVVSIVLSIIVGTSYVVFTDATFNAKTAVCIFALALISWVGSMIGYDKIIQLIGQYKNSGRE
jgi:hypothetical protein